MNKLVSVIIPTYSRASYIIRAIDSVLSQTYSNVEIIVVDDNGDGTDHQKETEKLLARYIDARRISYLKHDVNRNGSAARNTGIRASHGDYITFLDDDDELLKSKLECQVKVLELNHDFDGAYCGFQIIKDGRVLKRVKPTMKGNLQYGLLTCRWSFGTGSNPMFRRSVFDDIGLFDESFIRHQDVEFMVRFFRNHKIISVEDVLINRYIDSRLNAVDYKKLLCVKEKFLDTFKSDIESYPSSSQRTIYRDQYSDVACHAMMGKDYMNAFTLYKKANSFRLLSLRIIAKAIAYGFLNRKVE